MEVQAAFKGWATCGERVVDPFHVQTKRDRDGGGRGNSIKANNLWN
jgi:hypothetical protein